MIGLENMQGIQAARILAGHNVPVIAIANNPKHYTCRTKVCEDILYVENRPDEIIRIL